MGRWWRPVIVAAAVAAVSAGVWALLRFGLLNWLSDDKHPARPVVEGLSWMAAVLGLLLAVAAFGLQLRVQNRSEPAGSSGTGGGVHVEGGVHGTGVGPTFGVVSGGQVNVGQSPSGPPRPTRR